jgi:hypothetical protein
MLPATPFVADPVLNVIIPLLALDVTPDVKERDPDVPS